MFTITGKKLKGNEYKKTFTDSEYKVAKFEYECLQLVSEYVVLGEVKNDRYKQLCLYYKN